MCDQFSESGQPCDADLKRLREIAYNTTCSNTELGVFIEGIADRLESAIKAEAENAKLRQELSDVKDDRDVWMQNFNTSGETVDRLEAENEMLRHSSEYLASELSGILRRFGYITTAHDGMDQFKKNLVSILQKVTDLQKENVGLRQELEAVKNARSILFDGAAKLRAERDALRAALQKAVNDYGKPGGPWNVPSEPGAWIAMAQDALERTAS